jgi:hypothetical protein
MDTSPAQTSPVPQIVWGKSDRLLSGGVIAVRGAVLPDGDELRSVVSITVHLGPEALRVAADGSATATILVGPQEALGIGAWLRQAAEAAEQAGPPLFGWDNAADQDSTAINTDPAA